MTDQSDDPDADERREERAGEESDGEPNQYGGGDTEIDPVEQTDRVADDDPDADEAEDREEPDE